MRQKVGQSADSRNYSQDFYIRLIQQGTLKMTSVSPPRSRFTVCLHHMNEQEVSVFAVPQCQKHLTDCRIQILCPTRATVSAVRRFIDELTLPLQRLHTKNIVGIFFTQAIKCSLIKLCIRVRKSAGDNF